MLTNNFAGLVSLNCQSSSANYNVCKTTDGKPASGGYSWLRSIMPNSLLLKMRLAHPQPEFISYWEQAQHQQQQRIYRLKM